MSESAHAASNSLGSRASRSATSSAVARRKRIKEILVLGAPSNRTRSSRSCSRARLAESANGSTSGITTDLPTTDWADATDVVKTKETTERTTPTTAMNRRPKLFVCESSISHLESSTRRIFDTISQHNCHICCAPVIFEPKNRQFHDKSAGHEAR